MPKHKWFDVHLYPATLIVSGQTLDKQRYYLSERDSHINDSASARMCYVDHLIPSSANTKMICGVHAPDLVEGVPQLLVVAVQVRIANLLVGEAFKSKEALQESKCDLFTNEFDVPTTLLAGTISVTVTAGCDRVRTVPETFDFSLRRRRAGESMITDRFNQQAQAPQTTINSAGVKRGLPTKALQQPTAPLANVASGSRAQQTPDFAKADKQRHTPRASELSPSGPSQQHKATPSWRKNAAPLSEQSLLQRTARSYEPPRPLIHQARMSTDGQQSSKNTNPPPPNNAALAPPTSPVSTLSQLPRVSSSTKPSSGKALKSAMKKSTSAGAMSPARPENVARTVDAVLLPATEQIISKLASQPDFAQTLDAPIQVKQEFRNVSAPPSLIAHLNKLEEELNTTRKENLACKLEIDHLDNQ